MNLEDTENAINKNQSWDIWNKFNTKQQILPIQNGDIWGAHFENLYKDIPINQINSDQHIPSIHFRLLIRGRVTGAAA